MVRVGDLDEAINFLGYKFIRVKGGNHSQTRGYIPTFNPRNSTPIGQTGIYIYIY